MGAVITQALMDASSNSKKQKIDALKWLLDEKSNEDFKRVCCLADLEYKEVLSKVKKLLPTVVNGVTTKGMFPKLVELYNFNLPNVFSVKDGFDIVSLSVTIGAI